MAETLNASSGGRFWTLTQEGARWRWTVKTDFSSASGIAATKEKANLMAHDVYGLLRRAEVDA